MIVQERYIEGGRAMIRTYSDSGRYVMRDGIAYEEAIDPAETGREYTEGDVMPVDEADLAEAARILLGVSE